MSFTLLDGGLSTAIESLGESLNSSLWTGELLRRDPEKIRDAHQLYVHAGAKILISSSYQISFMGCKRVGWSEEDVHSALLLSTELARFSGIKVAASVGPYGAALADGFEYRGNYKVTFDGLKDFHRRRLEILVDSKPDYFAIETIPELREAQAILEVITEIGAEIPYWISFSCSSKQTISSGELFSDAVKIVSQSNGAMAVGINCTAPHLVTPLLSEVKSHLPFIVYPNSGRIWDPETKTWQGSENDALSSFEIREWVSLGATIIGGCCSIGPKEIAQLKPRSLD